MSYPFVYPNLEHQQREFDLYRKKRARALLWRMRTGKTKAMVDLACFLWITGRIDAVVVVAPNGVHLNWSRNEIPKHRWPNVPCISLSWDSQIVKRNYFKDLVARVTGSTGDLELPWLCLNSEGLLADAEEDMFHLLKRYFRGRRVLLIVDESDDFATPGSRRTKRMRAVAKYATYVRILTGTVIANTPLAAYSQFQLLEKGALGYDTFEQYEDHFAEYKQIRMRNGRTFPALQGYINLDELRDAMARWSSVVLRSDVKGLSELVPGIRTFRMTPRQENAYELMLKGLLEQDPALDFEDDDDSFIDEPEPFAGGVRYMKLQQITCGFVKDHSGKVIDLCGGWKKNPRIKTLLDQAEMEKGKVVTWCKFHEDIDRVSEALRAQRGRVVVEFHGRITNKQKEINLHRFQNDPTVTDLVGQPQSLGRGRDLSAANQMIFYSHVLSNVLREQASERATAMNQEPVAVTDLSAVGSIDEHTLESFTSQQSVSEQVAGKGLHAVLTDIHKRWLSVTQGQR